MLVFLTVCTARQLSPILALQNSIQKWHPNTELIIGLADAMPLPNPQFPGLVLPIADLWPAEDLARRSAQYTPIEFASATKPTFVRAVYERFTNADTIVYIDPTTFFYQSITDELARYPDANLLLTPHLSHPPADGLLPDEKHIQNVGLYTAGMLMFRRSDATARFLAWWESRVADRAFINFCDGLCLDQIWLMYAPAFLTSVAIVTTPGWNVGLWNLHEHTLTRPVDSNQWLVNGIYPLVSVNFCGLTNADDGLFSYQTRLDLTARADGQQLLADYRERIKMKINQHPAYGQRPEPPVLRGWRKNLTETLHDLNRQIATAPVPAGFTAITDRLRGLSGQ